MGVNINDSGIVKSLTAKLLGFTINGIDQIANNHRACDLHYGSSGARYYSFVDTEREYDYYFVKINSGKKSNNVVTPSYQVNGGSTYPRPSSINIWTKAECKIYKVTADSYGRISGIVPEPSAPTNGIGLGNVVGLVLDDQFPNKLIIWAGTSNWDDQTATPTPGVSIWGIY